MKKKRNTKIEKKKKKEWKTKRVKEEISEEKHF